MKSYRKELSLNLPSRRAFVSDEAHRTTGVERTELAEREASNFIAIHNPDFIKARKRLYMTATPRIYDDSSKQKAKEADVEIYSMDDETKYGIREATCRFLRHQWSCATQ